MDQNATNVHGHPWIRAYVPIIPLGLSIDHWYTHPSFLQRRDYGRNVAAQISISHFIQSYIQRTLLDHERGHIHRSDIVHSSEERRLGILTASLDELGKEKKTLL